MQPAGAELLLLTFVRTLTDTGELQIPATTSLSQHSQLLCRGVGMRIVLDRERVEVASSDESRDESKEESDERELYRGE